MNIIFLMNRFNISFDSKLPQGSVNIQIISEKCITPDAGILLHYKYSFQCNSYKKVDNRQSIKI